MNHLTTLESLLDTPSLRSYFGPHADWLDDVVLDAMLDRIFIRDLRAVVSPSGGPRSWTFDIVLPNGLGVDLPLPDLRLDVHPAATPGAPAVLAASASIHVPILQYLDSFDPAVLVTAHGSYEFLRSIAEPSPANLVAETIEMLIDQPDATQAFLDNYAATHGAALSVTVDADPQVTAANIAQAMEAEGVDVASYVFNAYVEASDLSAAYAQMSLLFNRWYEFTPADLQRITRPTIQAAFYDLELALSFPRNLLLPIKTADHGAAMIEPSTPEGAPLPGPHQARARATIDQLGFSTDLGLKTGSGVVFSMDEAEIGTTGVRLAVDQLTFDFSQTQTPRALREAGFSPAFMGLHASGARLGWLPQLQLADAPLPGVSIAVRDLAIGNEGIYVIVDRGWGIDDSDPFGSGSEMVAQLPYGWRVALSRAAGRVTYRRINDGGEVPDDWQTSLAVAGLIELPFWSVLLDVEFGLELFSEGARVRMAAALQSAPLTINLTESAELVVDQLNALGTLATDGSFMLTGTARGSLDIHSGNLAILQGTFDIPALEFAYTDQASLTFDGAFNATLFSGTHYSATIENLHTTLTVEADDTGVTDFRLDLSEFTAEFQITEQITIRVEDCLVDLNTAASPQAILDLGFDAGFVGLLAQSSSLRWDLPGTDQPLDVNVGLAAVGSGGAALHQVWDADEPEIVLFDELTLSIQEVDGVLALEDDATSRLDVAGRMQVPLLGLDLEGRLHLHQGPAGDQVRLNVRSDAIAVDFHGAGSLAIDHLELDGAITNDGFTLFGEITGGALTLSGFDDPFALGNTVISFEKTGELTKLTLSIEGLEIPLDADSSLSFGSGMSITMRDGEVTSVVISGQTSWDMLGVIDLPPFFPQPSSDLELEAELRWETDQWQVSFRAALEDAEPLLAMFPENLRPQTRDLEFEFNAAHEESDGTFSGQAAVSLDLRWTEPPQLPGAELVKLTTGDGDGWMRLRLTGTLEDDGGGNVSPAIEGELLNPLTMEVNLPGLPQREPPVLASFDEIQFDAQLAGDDGALVAGVELSGRFALRPITPSDLELPVPPAMAGHLERLFRMAGVDEISGTATQRIETADGRLATALTCTFDGATMELDVFDLFANVASNVGGPAGLDDPAKTIDLDIDVGFALKGISLQLGSLEEDATSFAMSLTVALRFAGLYADLTIALSDEEFSLGFEELRIPIALPELPMKLHDLNELRDGNGRWDYEGAWLTVVEPRLTQEINQSEQQLEVFDAEVEQIEAGLAGSLDAADREAMHRRRDQLLNHDLPDLQLEIFHATAKKFLIEAVLAIQNSISEGSRPAYQLYVESYQTLLDHTIGGLHLDTNMVFVISDARFVLPFDDPSDIRVEGAAGFDGFDHDDPLKPLSDLRLRLGLSAEMIYFAVEGGDPIPLPEFGRYTGGHIGLDHLRIGYGYSRNSLAIDFAGELRLPVVLVDDVDTSDVIGAGIRLPIDSKLRFKLDLIPVVLGEVDFLIPLFEFDVDLRRDGFAGVVDPANCVPAWDGLQLIVPNVIRAGFKRARFSPFFGPIPALNYNYSYDIDIGNDQFGVTYVCDNFLLIGPIFFELPVPLFADNLSPFFDNLCTNIRFAGFEVNFDLQRPFPSFSPMALFELMGFLADPMMEIDPEGDLANTVRATIQRARIVLPPSVVGMFPEWGRVLEPEINYTLNLATVISLMQAAVQGAVRIGEAVDAAAGDMTELMDQVTSNPPELTPQAMLEALPPELRRVKLQGSFVGFDATAWFFLLGPGEIAAAFSERREPPPPRGTKVIVDEPFDEPSRDWRPINHGFQKHGQWNVRRGAVEQTRKTGGDSSPYFAPILVYVREKFSDSRIRTECVSKDMGGVDIIFRYQDEQNYYRFRMLHERRVWVLSRIEKGRAVDLHVQRDVPFQLDGPYEVSVVTVNRRTTFKRARIGTATRRRALPGRGRPDRRPLPPINSAQGVRIEIAVNGERWATVDDPESGFLEGHVGVGAWMNELAKFHHVQVIRPTGDADEPPQRPADRDVASIRPNIPNDPTPTHDPGVPGGQLFADIPLLDEFSHEDLDGLSSTLDENLAGVLVAARVRVLNTQIYEFLGYHFMDGTFALVSRVDLEPLVLVVAGIEITFPIELHGRLALRGRSAGADSFAEVHARTWGVWYVLPKVAILEVASEEKPAQISIWSDGRFALQASARMVLFNEAAGLEGQVDLSNEHCLVAGRFEYAPKLPGASEPFLDFFVQCDGRIGPGPHFSFGGAGGLEILGQQFVDVAGRITEQRGEISARLATDPDKPWNLGPLSLPLLNAKMSLDGAIDFTGNPFLPSLSLHGAAAFGIFGAEINGRGGIDIDDGQWCISAGGALRWQGRDWLEGAIKVCHDRVQLSGQTSFALDLTPAQAGNVELANLFMKLDISGSFKLSVSGGLDECRLRVEWALAVQFPGTQTQSFTIAMQRTNINKTNLGAVGNLGDLFTINHLNLIPVGDFSVPVPVLDTANKRAVYVDTAAFVIPVLTDTKPNDDATPLFEFVPITTTDTPLTSLLENLNLTLRLAWKDGQLGIIVQRPGYQGELIAFEDEDGAS